MGGRGATMHYVFARVDHHRVALPATCVTEMLPMPCAMVSESIKNFLHNYMWVPIFPSAI